ncbi:hypothetical protein MUK42_25713 [Musa troglodytarum]|uniref:Pollen allergen Ole e 2 n=1 Tax=Musa troglodytarum TaxID=320322 RepID=A0A9E7I0R3_9LILI|nr:hypothetical protein MUK42_25713 [Musa troglodytarum]
MADWSSTHRLWEKWASNNVGSSGEPLKAALLLNYDPSSPSRLLSLMYGYHGEIGNEISRAFNVRHRAEQEGTDLKAVELNPFIDFVKRNNLQKEFFFIGPEQYLVTSIYEHWFCARCVNTQKPGGEGAIVMQIASHLLIGMYEGSIGAASRAMVAVDQLAWQLCRKSH